MPRASFIARLYIWGFSLSEKAADLAGSGPEHGTYTNAGSASVLAVLAGLVPDSLFVD